MLVYCNQRLKNVLWLLVSHCYEIWDNNINHHKPCGWALGWVSYIYNCLVAGENQLAKSWANENIVIHLTEIRLYWDDSPDTVITMIMIILRMFGDMRYVVLCKKKEYVFKTTIWNFPLGGRENTSGLLRRNSWRVNPTRTPFYPHKTFANICY